MAAAEAALRRALALAPTHVPSLVNLALLLQTRGDLPAALELYGRAMRQDPQTFGRIANALCSEPSGLLCLDLDALRRGLLGEG